MYCLSFWRRSIERRKILIKKEITYNFFWYISIFLCSTYYEIIIYYINLIYNSLLYIKYRYINRGFKMNTNFKNSKRDVIAGIETG